MAEVARAGGGTDKTAESPRSLAGSLDRSGLRRLAIFFAGIYFVQGFAEPKAGLAAQPIFFLLKDELGLSASETATFIAMVGIAWNVKPLYGLISDLVPLLGYHRRSYLLITTALATTGWLVLGVVPSHSYGLTLAILCVTGFGLAFTRCGDRRVGVALDVWNVVAGGRAAGGAARAVRLRGRCDTGRRHAQ